MVLTRRKGAFRYLLLAIIPQSLAKGFEAMGDRAVENAGQGHGAGTPYYLPALILTLVAAGLCLFALKRLYDRLTGKDGADGGQVQDRGKSAELGEIFSDGPGFDADLVMQRYLENRPAALPARQNPARTGGFGKKGL